MEEMKEYDLRFVMRDKSDTLHLPITALTDEDALQEAAEFLKSKDYIQACLVKEIYINKILKMWSKGAPVKYENK